LDYGQRLTSHHRNTFTSTTEGNSGAYAIRQSLLAGRAAMNNHETTYFEKGMPFDAVIYDANSALISTSSHSNLLPTIAYSSDSTHTLGTIVNGRWVVQNNLHLAGVSIADKFKKALKEIAVR